MLNEPITQEIIVPPTPAKEKKRKAVETLETVESKAEEERKGATAEKPKRRKRSKRKGSIVPLTKVETKTIMLEKGLYERTREMAKAAGRDAEASDVLSFKIFQMPKRGIKFKPQKREMVEVPLTLPVSAWALVEEQAANNGATIEEAVEEILKS